MGSGDGGDGATACAVVGTGDMGLALASALLAGGHRVTVWNRSPDRYASLLERGAEAAESVAAAVRAADLIVVCLLDYPVTREVLCADGVADAIAARTVLQFSYSSAKQAVALGEWVKQHGGNHLHGQIRAYPREIGTPAAKLTYSGAESTFQWVRQTVEVFGEPVYLGSDVAGACVVSSASTVLYECIVAAFFETAAYAAAEGAELERLLSLVPTAFRLAETTIEYSAHQIAAGEVYGDQASIDTHANAFATLVDSMAEGRREPRLARVVLDYLEDARRKELGSAEIAALYGLLADSVRAPDST